MVLDEAVAAASVGVHNDRRQRWQKPDFGRDDVLHIYNLKPFSAWSEPAVRAFRDAVRDDHPDEPPPYKMFVNLMCAGYDEPIEFPKCREHEPYVPAFRGTIAGLIRTTWRETESFGVDDLRTLYAFNSDYNEHLIQAVFAGLRPSFPNTPPPEKLFDHCYDAIYNDVLSDDEVPDHIDPNYHEHEPYTAAVKVAAEGLRRTLWAKAALTVEDYVELFRFEPETNEVVLELAERLRRALKATTHPVDPPHIDAFHDALTEIEQLGCFY